MRACLRFMDLLPVPAQAGPGFCARQTSYGSVAPGSRTKRTGPKSLGMTAGMTASKSSFGDKKHINWSDSTVDLLDAYKPVADVSLTFKFDKWDLTKEDKLALDDFVKQLETTKGYYLQVIGGGHGTGAAEHDDGLSYLRANAVVEYLGSKYGVAPHHFVLSGTGKNEEAASNPAPEGRQKNHRVEVRLLVKASKMSNLPAETGSPN